MEEKHLFPGLRQSSSILLLNMVMQFWQQRDPESPIEQAPFCIHENDKAFIRENIIKAMINCPELIRVQLWCLSKYSLLKNDYPGKLGQCCREKKVIGSSTCQWMMHQSGMEHW
ncbi:Importin-8 [Holothuria leucospilota]|uniref:Importin-8 n=1 Tax=Holothuria leucospilota TaxID=206669 RepID=A0A9Q0YAD9_HOLLE|nr:Importin-8 [Holothuria leucospilota]